MEPDGSLRITYEKPSVPIIYLDTCAMIELARYEKGNCTDAHKQQIGELYHILTTMKQEKRINCPLGNQLQEMGMTKDRKNARLFLYQFTDSVLLHPDVIETSQLQAGYRAFVNNETVINFDMHTAFEEDMHPELPFTIRANPTYSPEKAESLRCEKMHIMNVLNELKESKKVKLSFNEQLKAELESEARLFVKNAWGEPPSSKEAYNRYFEEMIKFYSITRSSPNFSSEQQTVQLVKYSAFLVSPYHDLLPYIWIRANLWARLLRRQNKIVQGDNLDVTWASAYLPFVDYAVTDDKFCNLLNESGLAELYETKVYSFKALDQLIKELKSCAGIVN